MHATASAICLAWRAFENNGWVMGVEERRCGEVLVPLLKRVAYVGYQKEVCVIEGAVVVGGGVGS
jgi:hypothetical protein